MKALISAAGISSAAGIGLAMLMPVVRPSRFQVACSMAGERGRRRRGGAAPGSPLTRL